MGKGGECSLSKILCGTRATCMPAPSSVVPFWDLRTRGRICSVRKTSNRKGKVEYFGG